MGEDDLESSAPLPKDRQEVVKNSTSRSSSSEDDEAKRPVVKSRKCKIKSSRKLKHDRSDRHRSRNRKSPTQSISDLAKALLPPAWSSMLAVPQVHNAALTPTIDTSNSVLVPDPASRVFTTADPVQNLMHSSSTPFAQEDVARQSELVEGQDELYEEEAEAAYPCSSIDVSGRGRLSFPGFG